jgi:hypothetical protein
MLFAAKELPMPNEDGIRRGMTTRPAPQLSTLMFAALLLFPIWLSSSAMPSQLADDAAILTLLNDQTAAWNRGDIEGFMNGYWHSDQTEFVSSEGVSRGCGKRFSSATGAAIPTEKRWVI